MKKVLLTMVAIATMCATNINAQNKVKYLNTNGKSVDVTMLENTDQTVQLTRYLFAGYNTLCLPMTQTADQLAKSAYGLKIERLDGIAEEGGTLSLYFTECTAEGIEAGVPYLVYSPKAQYLRIKNTDATAVNSKLQTVHMADAEGNMVTFGSSWNSRQQEGCYGIPAKQSVTPLESILVQTNGQTFLPTRCGISWEQKSTTATTIEIKHGEAPANTTGIRLLGNLKGSIDVYDLKGNLLLQQVTTTQAKTILSRGVYVVGGEKVIIK